MAKNNFEEMGLSDYVVQVRGHAPEIFVNEEIKNREFDFVFLDAIKKQYTEFLTAILPNVKRGGVIFADNINSHREALVGFLDYLEKSKEVRFTILDIGTGVAMIVKI